MNKQTAILIFTRTAQEEAQLKWSQQVGSTTNSCHIAQALINHTRQVAKATGFPVLEIASPKQQGASFGERLCHAVQQVWKAGFEQVLIVGTDTPELSSQLLQEAAQKISPTQSVVGAATDGGAYLIGLHCSQFQAKQFAALPWQQAHLYQALSTQLSQADQSLAVLPTLSDLDSWEALVQFIQTAPWSLLRMQVCYYLSSSKPATFLLPILRLAKKNYTTQPNNRPPPTGALTFA